MLINWLGAVVSWDPSRLCCDFDVALLLLYTRYSSVDQPCFLKLLAHGSWNSNISTRSHITPSQSPTSLHILFLNILQFNELLYFFFEALIIAAGRIVCSSDNSWILTLFSALFKLKLVFYTVVFAEKLCIRWSALFHGLMTIFLHKRTASLWLCFYYVTWPWCGFATYVSSMTI